MKLTPKQACRQWSRYLGAGWLEVISDSRTNRLAAVRAILAHSLRHWYPNLSNVQIGAMMNKTHWSTIHWLKRDQLYWMGVLERHG